MKRGDSDVVSNPSSNPSLEGILSLSRRQLMRGGLGVLALAVVGKPREAESRPALLGFRSVPLTGEDRVRVPPGYTAEVLYAWGDPVSDGPPWDSNARDTWVQQEQQAGMHHDGIAFFPLPYDSNASDHGLLAINHEYVDNGLLFGDGRDNWSHDKVRKAQAAHGVSVIEVALRNGRWQVVRPSPFGRRITAYTPMRVSGPAAGDPALRTAADPAGTTVLGTLANCNCGFTPWGTYLTCEENFHEYFANRGSIPADQARYGIAAADTGYRWSEFDGRFDAAANPNEPNRFGWVVEIDPFDPHSTPVKRTALGRMKHEGAWSTLAPDGRVVVYMGDDERFEYVYKFVSRDAWSPASRSANRDLLDNGTLYVARYGADGSGRWIALVFGQNGLDRRAGFSSQADVAIRARQAADQVGATKMDRPEMITVMPGTRDVFVTLTNNSQRGTAGQPGTDPANPRADNSFGHILRWTEDGSNPAATRFRWSVFVLCGDPRGANAAKRGNIKGDRFGSPDGLWGDNRGVLWIHTDVSAKTLGAGAYGNIPTNATLAADPRTGEIRRFLTGPRGCELAGFGSTPDQRTLFWNIQHPGEPPGETSDPKATAALSSWPDGRGVGRPRSATIVIRKDDGGVIGT